MDILKAILEEIEAGTTCEFRKDCKVDVFDDAFSNYDKCEKGYYYSDADKGLSPDCVSARLLIDKIKELVK